MASSSANKNQKSPNNNKAGGWGLVGGLVGVVGVAVAAYLGYQSQARSPAGVQFDITDYAARTEAILTTTPLIDGHNDLPFLLRLEFHNQIYNNQSFPFRETLASHTDLPRLKKGRVGGQFWSVFVDCVNLEGSLNDPTHVVRDTLEQIDVARRLIEDVPEFQFCTTAACVTQAFQAGRIPSMLGAEGLHQTGSSIAVLRQLFDLGVRYATITHNCDNAYATAASSVTASATNEDPGLTEFGRAGIREMNRLGMLVDLAHVSHQTMRDVLDLTAAPVIFSHTTCHALARHNRNAPDDVIARLKENGGVLMVMFVSYFLNIEDPAAADVETVVDHIMHVVEVAGWDHVGIGGDFDGTTEVARGISSVADYPSLIEAVMRRGATDAQIRKLVGENILRVWKKNEEVAAQLSSRMKPVEVNWEGRTWFSMWNDAVPRMIPNNPLRGTVPNTPDRVY